MIRMFFAMRYAGPIYRPPSEANSLLIQATIGCPHNRCTFCMIYKKRPGFRVRKISEIKEDLVKARELYGDDVRTLFLPDGNTIAMKTDPLCEICRFSRELFPRLERITVYGSAQYIRMKGVEALQRLAQAGLSRIHVGLESGDDEILNRIRKGTTSAEQIQAGRWVMAAGMELSLYVILGIGGKERSGQHALQTARVLNAIGPDFVRLRTLIPKIDTPLLEEIRTGRFTLLGPHEILDETESLLDALEVSTYLASDHYSNYIRIDGQLPQDKPRLIAAVRRAKSRPASSFRPFFIGTE